jgi:hypothetical protein
MKILPLQQLMERLPTDGRLRLERSLSRTETGFDTDLRSPLYKAIPREEIISALVNVLGVTKIDVIDKQDEIEREKVGSFSIMLPYSERKDDVYKYYHQDFHPDKYVFDEAIRRVKSRYPEHSMRAADFDTAYALMPKDTSLGLPHLTRNRRLADEYLRRATQVSVPSDIYPCVLYWRGQARGLKELPKQRVVWGFDHAETILGARILHPLIARLRMITGFSAWSGDVFVDNAITHLLRYAAGRPIVSMDYSGFDSSLSRALLDAVDGIISYWFEPSVTDLISLLGEISATVDLVTPEGLITERNGGMPSGSVLTNIRDTLVSWIAGTYTALRHRTAVLGEYLGDDSVLLFEKEIKPDLVCDTVLELGLISNPDKLHVDNRSVHYLQRIHTLDYMPGGVCRGVRSPYRALSGMMSYERFRNDWNAYMDSARWIMQAENVKWHPKFPDFVKFMRDGDEILRKGVPVHEIFRRAGGAEKIRSVLNIASFPFNIQDPDKANIFETTRILSELNQA